jgi:biotin operon repressor
VRAGILSEKIVVCDYAREGCTKYVGPGQYAYNNQKIAVQEALRKGELLSIQRLQTELGLGKQVIMSNVHRLRKQGIEIRTEQVNGEIHYQLNNKVS